MVQLSTTYYTMKYSNCIHVAFIFSLIASTASLGLKNNSQTSYARWERFGVYNNTFCNTVNEDSLSSNRVFDQFQLISKSSPGKIEDQIKEFNAAHPEGPNVICKSDNNCLCVVVIVYRTDNITKPEIVDYTSGDYQLETKY